MNRLREKLKSCDVIVGMQCFTGSPAMVEIMGWAGFDWVSIDTEHSSTTTSEVENVIRAADASGIIPLVRVARNDPIEIMKALDSGAAGVIVPHVETADDLRRAISATRYEPEGVRGACSTVRSARYSLRPWNEYFRDANDSAIVVPLIEGVTGIENIDSILAVEGYDALWVGIRDLAQSYNLPGADFSDGRLRDVAVEVCAKAKARGKALMATTAPPLTREYADLLVRLGFRAISFGTDESIFAKACKEIAALGR